MLNDKCSNETLKAAKLNVALIGPVDMHSFF